MISIMWLQFVCMKQSMCWQYGYDTLEDSCARKRTEEQHAKFMAGIDRGFGQQRSNASSAPSDSYHAAAGPSISRV